MNLKRVIFLDRDGIINEDFGYVYKIENFKFKENIFLILKELSILGFEFIIITNQSGIGRGYYTDKDFQILTNYMLKKFKEFGIEILDVFYCSYYVNSNDEKYRNDDFCRKPNIGMIVEACKKYDIDLNKSFLIGDKLTDIELGKKVGLKTILVSKDKFNFKEIVPDYFIKELNLEIVNFIKLNS